METEEICDICDKSVPSMSIQMHKIHCERNTVKCPKCDEKMSKFELEKHTAENHTLKKCDTCLIQLELRFFSAHDCPKKPVMCEFCEASFPKDQIRIHQLECGNRTEECPRCKEFIKRREYREHIQARMCKDYAERLREKEQEKELKRRLEAEARRKEAEEKHKEANQLRKREAEQQKKREEDEIKKVAEEKRKIGQHRGPEVRKTEEKVVKSVKEEAKSGVPRARATTFNSSQKKLAAKPADERKPKAASELRANNFNPKPSPKINAKPVQPRANLNDFKDYSDMYDIPDETSPMPELLNDDVFNIPPLRKRSPNPITESRNFAEYEDQILQQVIAESEKDFIGIDDSVEAAMMNQVLLNSIKEK